LVSLALLVTVSGHGYHIPAPPSHMPAPTPPTHIPTSTPVQVTLVNLHSIGVSKYSDIQDFANYTLTSGVLAAAQNLAESVNSATRETKLNCFLSEKKK